MATEKKPAGDRPVEAASAAPGEKRSAARPEKPAPAPLARASESGNPDVHKALGDLQTAQMNLGVVAEGHDAADPDAVAAERDARARLRDLGFE